MDGLNIGENIILKLISMKYFIKRGLDLSGSCYGLLDLSGSCYGLLADCTLHCVFLAVSRRAGKCFY